MRDLDGEWRALSATVGRRKRLGVGDGAGRPEPAARTASGHEH
jgi:hypothetical protein